MIWSEKRSKFFNLEKALKSDLRWEKKSRWLERRRRAGGEEGWINCFRLFPIFNSWFPIRSCKTLSTYNDKNILTLMDSYLTGHSIFLVNLKVTVQSLRFLPNFLLSRFKASNTLLNRSHTGRSILVENFRRRC